MVNTYPAFAMFPDLNVVIRTPSGIEYRGKFRQHPSTKEEGEHWYEGYVKAISKDDITADTNVADRFNKHSEHPDYFDSASRAEPLRVKLNRIPKDQRSDKNADTLIGELWNHQGLWTVIASPSKSDKLHLAGNVVPSRQELGFEGSAIARYQEQRQDEKPAGAHPS